MAVCSFCENEMMQGTGILFVKRDGSLSYFCSSKCRKNVLQLGREGRRKKWTRAFRIFKGREKRIETKTVSKASKKADKPAEFAPGAGMPKQETK